MAAEKIMYSPLQLAAKYLRYYCTASNGKGHGVHSPFVYDFIRKVLMDRAHYPAYDKVEDLRRQLAASETIVEVEDFGAGSITGNKKQRKVADIVRTAAKPKKLGRLLYRIVQYYQPSSIIELGTSLGLSTAYMSYGNPSANITTIEGAPAIANIASNNFSSLQLNIHSVTGNFDQQLPVVLSNSFSVDLAFIDGNHRKQPTIQYFEQLLENINENSILIFDDIHWSKEMEEAWEIICEHPAVTCTIDLFFIGIVVFKKDFKVKQHFTLRF